MEFVSLPGHVGLYSWRSNTQAAS